MSFLDFALFETARAEGGIDDDRVDEDGVWPSDTIGPIGAWMEGHCLACSRLAPLPEIQLCASCLARWHRDLIRQRQWQSSDLARDLSAEEREALRHRIITRFGEEFEIFDHELTGDPTLDLF